MGFYSTAVEKNVCSSCDGRKTQRIHHDDDTSHDATCGHCGGSGLPTEEDKLRASREKAGLCTRCGVSLDLHEGCGDGHTFGCIMAAHAKIRELEGRIARLEEKNG